MTEAPKPVRVASEWDWARPRSSGIWAWGPKWAHPLCAAAPWITVALLVAEFAIVGGRALSIPGMSFDLPSGILEADSVPSMTALMLPVARDGALATLVYFDDARFVVSDPAGAESLRIRLRSRSSESPDRTVLLLADRTVPAGDLVKFAETARAAGVVRVQVAEKEEKSAGR